ncbi:MAG TPA: TatD family hydrolase [Thermoanaerobaculia bacterium]|nr:TatD family hydrolase [Thermoanaerobaculia bacterium]HUM29323.1 TatD family hydrolase [Thermoanaerobaculia bacterium]HXK67719.1 TatD family hydrolase [Thermoanaerobaculia bacterium]
MPEPMNLIDAHCHLYSLDHPEEEVQRAKDAGVESVICVSEDLKTMEAVLAIRDRFPDFVLPGLGIHPAESVYYDSATWERSLNFLQKHAKEAVCMGEIGLDFKHAEDETAQSLQRSHLHAQMEIAEAHRLPINLHSRRALRQTMEEAISFHKKTGLQALLHWFAHSKKLLRATNAEGIFVSAGPSILFSEEACSTALTIDLHLILVETDTPVPYSGQFSRPTWTSRVADHLVRADSSNRITRRVLSENTYRYLGRS